MTTNFTINQTLKAYIPAQTADERARLLASIKAEGVREPLIIGVLPCGTKVLVDGHHRWSCIEELGTDTNYLIIEKDFVSFEHIKSYMRDIQLGRRNISKSNRAKLIADEYSLTTGVREIVKRYRNYLGSGQSDTDPSFYDWAKTSELTETQQGLLFNTNLIDEILAKPELKSKDIVGAKFEVSGSTVARVIKSRNEIVKSLDNPFWYKADYSDAILAEHKKSELSHVPLPDQEDVDRNAETLYDRWDAEGKPDISSYQKYLSYYLLCTAGQFARSRSGLSFSQVLDDKLDGGLMAKSDYKSIINISKLRQPEVTQELSKAEQQVIDYLIGNPGSVASLTEFTPGFKAKCYLNKINIIHTEKGYYSVPKSIPNYLISSYYSLIELNQDDNFTDTVIVGKYAQLLLDRVDKDELQQKILKMGKNAMKVLNATYL